MLTYVFNAGFAWKGSCHKKHQYNYSLVSLPVKISTGEFSFGRSLAEGKADTFSSFPHSFGLGCLVVNEVMEGGEEWRLVLLVRKTSLMAGCLLLRPDFPTNTGKLWEIVCVHFHLWKFQFITEAGWMKNSDFKCKPPIRCYFSCTSAADTGA